MNLYSIAAGVLFALAFADAAVLVFYYRKRLRGKKFEKLAFFVDVEPREGIRRSTKIDELGRAVFVDPYRFWTQVAMQDVILVEMVQSASDVARNPAGVVEW